MATGISNRWPSPPEGFLTTKEVIKLGGELVEYGKIKHPIPQPQVLLAWLNASPAERRRAGWPTMATRRHLRRGPGPRGGRYEWPFDLAVEIQEWYSHRQEQRRQNANRSE